MLSTKPNIELLQAEIDEDDQSFFRLRVGKTIKYLTIEPGLYSTEDMCFGPSLLSILPAFPPGDWNDGLIARNPETGQPFFARAMNTKLPSVMNTWHNVSIDYADIEVGEKLRTGVYEVTVASPLFETVVVAKFARFSWEIAYLDNETRAYQWIDGHDIAPRFLGHLTEDNGDDKRVIGFLMERVTGARHAGARPGDAAACQTALGRLHRLGIRHGDVNRFNFLVQGGRAVLIDFDTARKCDHADELRRESEMLEAALLDASGRGGGGILCRAGTGGAE
ncbi:uncharacterized protein DSM5745_04128 [Aspergillus mulundensis]|uniref:Alpha-galactosidase A n=1 Tax=Aspergillus mulundensis TaxID=1810919 RepID=A0A3D8SBR4_9EURO|nr:Uncharacterized protein DSM5745_04128 [Aspergillus mulundensis]RDW83802.1 Uncharacterized protein DSM5745_04128 [Aspergillus mulundensis]